MCGANGKIFTQDAPLEYVNKIRTAKNEGDREAEREKKRERERAVVKAIFRLMLMHLLGQFKKVQPNWPHSRMLISFSLFSLRILHKRDDYDDDDDDDTTSTAMATAMAAWVPFTQLQLRLQVEVRVRLRRQACRSRSCLWPCHVKVALSGIRRSCCSGNDLISRPFIPRCTLTTIWRN